MRKWKLALILLLLPVLAVAEEGPFLTSDILRDLQPAYEAFLSQLAERLIANDLLQEADRDAWVNYQLGDYYQNGGYGAITALYTPGLLEIADESVALCGFTVETEAGTLRFNTLNRYSTAYSPLPGLPLDDVELVGEDGVVVDCRYGWSAPHGSLLLWDGASGVAGEMINVGATYANDGKPLFWSAEPVDGIEENLTLTLFSAEEDRTLAVVELLVVSGPNFWTPESMLIK